MTCEILFFVAITWWVSVLFALLIIMVDDEVEISNLVVFLFPANLIFVIKYWWKAIIKSIKS
jgi:hypothetical protein